MTETINQKDTRTSVEFETKFYDAVIQESCEGPPLQTIITSEKHCSNEKFCNWAQCQVLNQSNLLHILPRTTYESNQSMSIVMLLILNFRLIKPIVCRNIAKDSSIWVVITIVLIVMKVVLVVSALRYVSFLIVVV